MEKIKKKTGRPKSRDREQIALDMIAWAKLETSLNLNEFCFKNMLDPSKLTLYAQENDSFRQSFNIVKAALASRRERKLAEGKLSNVAYTTNAKTYDHFAKETYKELKRFEADLTGANADRIAQEQKQDEIKRNIEEQRAKSQQSKLKF